MSSSRELGQGTGGREERGQKVISRQNGRKPRCRTAKQPSVDWRCGLVRVPKYGYLGLAREKLSRQGNRQPKYARHQLCTKDFDRSGLGATVTWGAEEFGSLPK
jgi:hypothetical protein